MEDIAEQQEVANEIAEAISNPVGFGQDLDEDELLKELEELEQVVFFYLVICPIYSLANIYILFLMFCVCLRVQWTFPFI